MQLNRKKSAEVIVPQKKVAFKKVEGLCDARLLFENVLSKIGVSTCTIIAELRGLPQGTALKPLNRRVPIGTHGGAYGRLGH